MTEPLTRRSEAASGDVPGWHPKELAGRPWRLRFMFGFGVLSVIAGLGIAAGERGAERGAAAAIVLFGLALIFTGPLYRPVSRNRTVSTGTISHGGQTTNAVLFPYSRLRSQAAMLGLTFMAGSSTAIAVFASAFTDADESPLVTRLVAAGIAAFFGWLAFNAWRRGAGRGWQIALSPGGVAIVAGGVRSFVPWDAIESVSPFQTETFARGFPIREPFLGLRIGDRDRVEVGRVEKALMRANRAFGADVSYPVRTLDVDPALLYRAVLYYWRNPAARSELGGEQAVRRITDNDF